MPEISLPQGPLIDKVLGVVAEVVGSGDLMFRVEKRKLKTIARCAQEALARLGMGDRFQKYPIDWSHNVEQAEEAWLSRQESGIKSEVVAVVPYVNGWPNPAIFSKTEVFLAFRPTQVPRKSASGETISHQVKPDEGAGQFVPHWMGSVDADDFAVVKRIQAGSTQERLGFRNVLFNRTLIREFAEEIEPGVRNWEHGFLQHPEEVNQFPSFLDKKTRVIVHPFAFPLNRYTTHTDLIAYYYSGLDAAKIYKQDWMVKLREARDDLRVEFDIDLDRSRFMTLERVGRDISSGPDKYLPGFINIVYMLATHRGRTRSLMVTKLD